MFRLFKALVRIKEGVVCGTVFPQLCLIAVFAQINYVFSGRLFSAFRSRSTSARCFIKKRPFR